MKIKKIELEYWAPIFAAFEKYLPEIEVLEVRISDPYKLDVMFEDIEFEKLVNKFWTDRGSKLSEVALAQEWLATGVIENHIDNLRLALPSPGNARYLRIEKGSE